MKCSVLNEDCIHSILECVEAMTVPVYSIHWCMSTAHTLLVENTPVYSHFYKVAFEPRLV